MRVFAISPLPFVIAFILGGRLKDIARQAYSATGNDPFFLVNNPIAATFMALASGVVVYAARTPKGDR